MNILNRQVPVLDLARFSDDPKEIAAFELIQFAGILGVVDVRHEFQSGMNDVNDDGWFVTEKRNNHIDQRLGVRVAET